MRQNYYRQKAEIEHFREPTEHSDPYFFSDIALTSPLTDQAQQVRLFLRCFLSGTSGKPQALAKPPGFSYPVSDRATKQFVSSPSPYQHL